jgi:hypothetical protein
LCSMFHLPSPSIGLLEFLKLLEQRQQRKLPQWARFLWRGLKVANVCCVNNNRETLTQRLGERAIYRGATWKEISGKSWRLVGANIARTIHQARECRYKTDRQ